MLVLETIYKNFYDYRSNSLRPRYTSTIYYYAKSSKGIDQGNMSLTNGEISEGFKSAFVKKKQLLEMLAENHSDAVNGVFFDEENRIIIENYFKDKDYCI